MTKAGSTSQTGTGAQQAAEALKAKQEAEALAQQQAAQSQNTSDNTPDYSEPSDSSGSSGTSWNPPSEASASELDEMAAILECEAGTSDYEALLAVASVIKWNRKQFKLSEHDSRRHPPVRPIRQPQAWRYSIVSARRTRHLL